MSKKVEPRMEVMTDLLEIRRMLDRAVGEHAKMDVKIPSLKIEYEAEIDDRTRINDGILVPVPRVYGSSLKVAEREDRFRIDTEVFLIIYVKGRLLLGIQGTQLRWDEATEIRSFRIIQPWKTVKIQRRKETRWDIPDGYELLCEIPSPETKGEVETHRLADLSPSGLAFEVLSEAEARNFPIGHELRGMRLQLENFSFSANAVVRNHVPFSVPGTLKRGVKIGMEFTQITPQDQKALASFVQVRLLRMAH